MSSHTEHGAKGRSHSDHGKPSANGTFAPGPFGVIIGLAILAALFTVAINKFPGIEKTFSLSQVDVVMIFVSSLLFITLWQVMAKVVFAPYLALFESREAATTGAIEQAKSILNQAEETRVKYETALGAARIEAMNSRLIKINSAKAEAAVQIEKAEEQAQEAVRKVRWELATNMEELRKQALKDAQDLADSLVERIGA